MISSILLEFNRTDRKEFGALAIFQGGLEQLENYTQMLHPSEISEMENHKFEKRKLSYGAGRVASKAAILELADFSEKEVKIGMGVFGFPVVEGLNFGIQLSIAHQGENAIAVAFKEGHPLGIDLELISSKNDKAIESQLTEGEKILVNKEFGHDTTMRHLIFSAKEALSKILKTGLMIDFKILEVKSIVQKNEWLQITFENFPQYKAAVAKCHRHAIALVFPKASELNSADKVFTFLRKIL